MEQAEKNLPLSMVALVFGLLSIPLAFTRHLVSLALVLAVLAFAFGRWGGYKSGRHLLRYSSGSIKRADLGMKAGGVGGLCAVVMWALWATNTLF